MVRCSPRAFHRPRYHACFAQLLGDDIIKSAGQIKLGVNVPANVQTYRPM
jgi:hypothetical protein